MDIGETMSPNPSQDPSSFGWKAGENIVPFTYPGVIPVSFPAGVAAPTVPLWTALLNELVPHINGGLQVGSCWGYEMKQNTNNASRLSFHAYGLALDINAPSNPNGSSNVGKGVGKYQLPSETEGIAAKYGCEWLGDSDPMHIECHLPPDEIAQYTGGVVGATTTAAQSVPTGVTASVAGKGGLLVVAGVAIVGAVIVFSSAGIGGK